MLDNLDTPEAPAEAERLMAKVTGGHLVVTSRLRNFSGDFEPLELDVLTVEDAATFLMERTDRYRRRTDHDAAAARSLATELDGLALALEQAGAYIARQGLTFDRYAQLWRENWPKVAFWAEEKITRYPRAVAMTWQTSVDQLGGSGTRREQRSNGPSRSMSHC